MHSRREQVRLIGGTDAVVTYARVPPPVTPPGEEEAAGSILTGVEVPFVARSKPRGAPDERIADERSAEDKRRQLPRIAVVVGAMAIVIGLGALAVAYNTAVNAPVNRTAATVTDVPEADAQTTVVERTIRAVGSDEFVFADEPLASVDLGAVEGDVAPSEPVPPETATLTPSAEDNAGGPPPTPRTRPANAAQLSRSQATTGQPAVEGTEMDALMAEIDRIIASAKSESEPAAAYPPPETPAGSSPLVVALPLQQPLVVTPPATEPLLEPPSATVAEAPPASWVDEPPRRRWWQIGPLRPRPRRAAPLPPAEIPEAQPQTPGWW